MTHMTRQIVTCALIAAAALAGAPSAEAQALKIGFVNFGKLLEESPQAKAAQASLEGSRSRCRRRATSSKRKPP